MTLMYFSWIREIIGKSSETVILPNNITTVNDLLDHLSLIGPEYDRAFQKRAQIKVAINHVHVSLSNSVDDKDEVALFPPITGG